MHPIERVQTVQGIDQWNGYHWTLTRQLAQEGDWTSLKRYMNTMGETYLGESMQHLIQSASPRLCQTYWPATSCPDCADPHEDVNDDGAIVKRDEAS